MQYNNTCDQLCENPPCSHMLHAFTKIFDKLIVASIVLHYMDHLSTNMQIFVGLQEAVPCTRVMRFKISKMS